MSVWVVPTIVAANSVALALISRLRWRCYPNENGKCTMVSGCTEHALTESGGIDASEFVINDLVQYEYVKNALMANPSWKNDPSVPQGGNPFEREEILVI